MVWAVNVEQRQCMDRCPVVRFVDHGKAASGQCAHVTFWICNRRAGSDELERGTRCRALRRCPRHRQTQTPNEKCRIAAEHAFERMGLVDD
jgi:hypothetical protein